MKRLMSSIAVFGSLIKFSHTIFAMPFALSMFVIASSHAPVQGREFLWILVALVAARTAAMTFNRLLDCRIDARNPRTATRELPAGRISAPSVIALLITSAVIFVASAEMLGRHCLMLSPLVLGVLFFYSYTKRFTSGSHFVLGLCLALAPGGVWYAITARFALLPCYLMLAVVFWVAGFDIIYSCQDIEFDRKERLHSMPARLGVGKALAISRLLHVLTLLLLFAFGWAADLGIVYYLGMFVFGSILASQHMLISPMDLTKADAAFFSRNGLAGLLYFIVVVIDRLFAA